MFCGLKSTSIKNRSMKTWKEMWSKWFKRGWTKSYTSRQLRIAKQQLTWRHLNKHSAKATCPWWAHLTKWDGNSDLKHVTLLIFPGQVVSVTLLIFNFGPQFLFPFIIFNRIIYSNYSNLIKSHMKVQLLFCELINQL